MQCKCGGEIRDFEHKVLTIRKGVEWFAECTDAELPLLINQKKCNGCTQTGYEVRNFENMLLKRHG